MNTISKMTVNTVDRTAAQQPARPMLTYRQALLMARAEQPGGFETMCPERWPEFHELVAMGLVEELHMGCGVSVFVAVEG